MNYTTIEESEVLLSLGVDPETADMCFLLSHCEETSWTGYGLPSPESFLEYKHLSDAIPCWSLSGLLELLPGPYEIQPLTFAYPFLDVIGKRLLYKVGGAVYEEFKGETLKEAILKAVLFVYEKKGKTEL